MSDLADITGYPFFPEPVEGYATVVQHSRNKQALSFAYGSGGTIGRTKGMIPLYHALRPIFWVSLSPKAGSSDEFWGTAIDLLVYVHERNRIDVLDFMFEEMMACVFEKKAGVYAPFIQALISASIPTSRVLLVTFRSLCLFATRSSSLLFTRILFVARRPSLLLQLLLLVLPPLMLHMRWILLVLLRQ